MAIVTNAEYTAEGAVEYPGSDGDVYSRETQFHNLHASVRFHTHAAGRGVQIPTAGVELLAITSALLADLAVTAGKIADLAVTAGKIADLAVTTSKIADGNVILTKLAADITDIMVTLAGAQSLTNKTLTSPKVGTSILDTNGNELLRVVATGSAVNDVTVRNAVTGSSPSLEATGDDANIDLALAGKGSGKVRSNANYGSWADDADAATVTFDLAYTDLHRVTLGGNRTLAVSNVSVGQSFIIRLLQDATGSRTVTFWGTIKWAGGVAPTLTTAANKADMLGFVCTSAGNYDGLVVGSNI